MCIAGPPVFSLGGINPRMVTVDAGDSYSFNCTVTESFPSNPTITLTTPQGNIDITSNPILTVQNIQSSFTYTCTADNTKFTRTLTFIVTVLGTSRKLFQYLFLVLYNLLP